MPNAISLEEAIRKGIINEGDLVNPYGLYYKRSQRIYLKYDEVGTYEVKSFDRENNLKCFFCEDSSGIPTLWFENLSYELCLKGKKGCLNGISTLNKVCNLYSNINLGMVARPVNKDDILYLSQKEESHKRLNEFENPFWLDSYCTTFDGKKTHYIGLQIGYKDKILNGSLYCIEEDNESLDHLGVRPAVSIYLPSQIMVSMETYDRTRGWKLIPNR